MNSLGLIQTINTQLAGLGMLLQLRGIFFLKVYIFQAYFTVSLSVLYASLPPNPRIEKIEEHILTKLNYFFFKCIGYHQCEPCLSKRCGNMVCLPKCLKFETVTFIPNMLG